MDRFFLIALAGLLGVVPLGCKRITEPIPVSYLAIVPLISTPAGVSPGTRYSYRVQEVSGTLHIDTTLAVAPFDTVFLQLPPATYTVTLDGLPGWCDSRYGAEQYLAVFDGPSTALVRYYITCRATLTVQMVEEGPGVPDAEMVYTLSGAGVERYGITHAPDTHCPKVATSSGSRWSRRIAW